MTSLLENLKSPKDLRAMSIEQLTELAAEIRQRIIAQVSATGGHLAPNLGVVELTIAMHYVFDFGQDRLLFDVGHQCYPHKLLTGRLPLLGKLRTRSGMAGFPAPDESPYDLFSVGHAGTGISTAVGMARGDTLGGEGFDPATNPGGRRAVALIGDASIVNGVAMEGLNNAGTLQRQFLVVLNDNGMSISKPQGAMAQYFDRVRLSHIYGGFKKQAKQVLSHVPGGSLVREAYHKMGEATKAMIAEGAWFEHFGLVTVGPIDGHDLPQLIEFLTEAREFDRPMVLHVKTVKGKGLDFAEQDATTFHSPKPFTVREDLDDEGCRVELKSGGRSFTAAFADAMNNLMERDDKAVACTAAMPDGTGMSKVMPRFPDRTWDTGICESHAMDMMAGMAKTGFRPFFAVYSTFLQRAFDQAFQEVSLQGLAVRLCLDRAGLVGGDGAVHHGFCDIALLRTLPEAALLAPIDEPSMIAGLEFMRTYDAGLSAIRYPRDDASPLITERLGDTPAFELGKARCLTPGLDARSADADCAVLAFGTPAIHALQAAEELSDDGLRVSVYDARFAKPVDADLVESLARRGVPIVTVEDHAIIGGFGAAVVDSMAERNAFTTITRLGIPDEWIHQDSRSKQLAEAGIDRAGISRAIRDTVGKHRDGSGARQTTAHAAEHTSRAATSAR